MEERAQGAIEYLLIIGAAILVVAVVVIALTGVLGGAKTQANGADVNGTTEKLQCQANCGYLGDTNQCGNKYIDIDCPITPAP